MITLNVEAAGFRLMAASSHAELEDELEAAGVSGVAGVLVIASVSAPVVELKTTPTSTVSTASTARLAMIATAKSLSDSNRHDC